MEDTIKSKQTYVPPIMDMVQLVTERTIAESGNYKVTLDEWGEDPNPTPAAYDGDIWLNL
jgi:hypothetical protein